MTGLPPRWLNTQRYALRAARDVRRAGASLVKLALALRTAAMLGCFDKQRCAATGLPARWLDTRRYALRSALEASMRLLCEAGFDTAYCGSARLLWQAATRGDGPAAALARHSVLHS